MKYKGELEGFPEEVVNMMLNEQERQGNKRDVTVFERNRVTGKPNGGFTWEYASQIADENVSEFWCRVLFHKDFDLFFKHFPKEKTFPRVMWVSDDPITYETTRSGATQKRVVFMEKNGLFLAWAGAKTIEEAEKEICVTNWKYAVDIDEIKKIVELTVKDISEGKGVGVPPHLIRIKE